MGRGSWARLAPKYRRRRLAAGAVALCLLALLAALVFWLAGGREQMEELLYPREYSQYVEKYSAQYGVDPLLVYAVIYNESRFRPDAQSEVGARGLMQMMEDAFEWTKYRLEPESDAVYDDMYDPETNIRYGTYMLSLLLEEFGTVDNALCAYHAGWGSVKNWLADPAYSSDGVHVETIPFADTRTYVERVNKTLQIYQRLYG